MMCTSSITTEVNVTSLPPDDPITPGEVLREEFLEPLGITAYRLAQEIHVQQTRVGEILAGRRAITADTALRLAAYFGTTPEFWLNLQARHDLELALDTGRAAFRRLSALGLTDALESRHPKGRLWTFWDYQAGAWQRDAGFRIDHLMLSPEAADRLVDAGVDKDYRGREKASDHAATWIVLD
jgi:exodeoxyribonuclease-3